MKPGRWDWLLDRHVVLPSMVFLVVAWGAGYFAALYEGGLEDRWHAVPPVAAAPATHPLPKGDMSLDEIAQRYGPVPFDHARHMTMAPGGCTDCHHTGETVKCSSCHEPHAQLDSDVPSLKGAYHRQCLDCHEKMGGPTGCTDCHLPAAAAQPSADAGEAAD